MVPPAPPLDAPPLPVVPPEAGVPPAPPELPPLAPAPPDAVAPPVGLLPPDPVVDPVVPDELHAADTANRTAQSRRGFAEREVPLRNDGRIDNSWRYVACFVRKREELVSRLADWYRDGAAAEDVAVEARRHGATLRGVAGEEGGQLS